MAEAADPGWLDGRMARPRAGALLNPRVDTTFKALFTQDTDDSRGALRSFLEAATEKAIRTVELRPNDAPKGCDGQRGVSFDVLCVFDDGQPADIEMQAFNQKYDYGKRAEYQVARLETTYLGKGDPWERAPEVYQITVLDFTYDAGAESAVSRFAMRTKDGRELSGRLNVVFVELPKARKLEGSVERNTALENWAIFLKDADDPDKRNVIEKLMRKEEGLMLAQNTLSSISEDRDLWIAQYREEVRERDEISSREAFKREGLAEGREEAMLEAARRLLAMGQLEEARVAQATGLPPERVRRLAEEGR